MADIPLVGIPVRLELDGECHTTTTERGGGFWFPVLAGATCHLVAHAEGYTIRTVTFCAADSSRPGEILTPA